MYKNVWSIYVFFKLQRHNYYFTVLRSTQNIKKAINYLIVYGWISLNDYWPVSLLHNLNKLKWNNKCVTNRVTNIYSKNNEKSSRNHNFLSQTNLCLDLMRTCGIIIKMSLMHSSAGYRRIYPFLWRQWTKIYIFFF